MKNKNVKKVPKTYGAALAPYSVWSVLFVVVPLIFIAYYAFTDNQFNYTETGLLDCTHIHFFTDKSAKKMFEEAGFDIEMLNAVCEAVSVPVIASGGAGSKEDFATLFETLPKVDAGLAASVFHFGQIKIPELKKYLVDKGISMRL